jgi:WS/DGAT/MGAT family acyltransferase
MAGRKVTLLDSVFLAGESRETMMHVGGLMPFMPAADTAPDFLRRLMEEIKASREVLPPWNFKLRTPEVLAHPLQRWVEDDDIDLDYHVRRSALPSPGDERELGVLVSRLHSHQLDFTRPPWELHIIEGLSGGRFALYAKIHHSLVDGFTAMRMLARSLSSDPGALDTPMFYALPQAGRPAADTTVPSLGAMVALARDQLGTTKNVSRAMLNLVRAARTKDRDLVMPLMAPKAIFNRRVSRSRRFATQDFALPRLKEVARRYGATLNDLVMAIVGGALRRLLAELGALPSEPLIAMLPVNVRPQDDPGGGNAVGAILASMGTDVAAPERRLEAIVASTRRAKEQLMGMSKSAIMQYSYLLMAPLTFQHVTGIAGRVRPAFNVIVSNVPGPQDTLFFRGARLEATYPLSIAFHGYGLNVTLNSYADRLNFGFIGCRDALPHLQRLAVYSADALAELERALGPSPEPA